MNIFNLFRRPGSAPLARERLQILLSHERSICGDSDLIGVLRGEILAALGKHITVGQDNVVIRMDRGATLSTLEIEVLIPHPTACLSPALIEPWPRHWGRRTNKLNHSMSEHQQGPDNAVPVHEVTRPDRPSPRTATSMDGASAAHEKRRPRESG